MKTYVKLFGVDEHELIDVERNAENDMTDMVIARNVKKGYKMRIASSIVVSELLRGNVIYKED